jgi:hypothetical protein
MNRKRKYSPAMLRVMDWVMGLALVVAGAFLLYDAYASMAKDVPVMGWARYLSGPIFMHKVSEIVIAGGWLYYAMLVNHEAADIWPKWIGLKGYGLGLRITAAAALVATILATYAWTIINLGTSAQTTDFTPVGIQQPDEALIWYFYLGAVVVAGAAYVVVAGYKGLKILFAAPQTHHTGAEAD